jgi:hypothetical protein
MLDAAGKPAPRLQARVLREELEDRLQRLQDLELFAPNRHADIPRYELASPDRTTARLMPYDCRPAGGRALRVA